MSVGSTPLAKHPSNHASDYASSPVKTKTVTGMLTKPWNMSLFVMFFSLSLVEQRYSLLSRSIKPLFWCSDMCFIGDPRVCCHLGKAVKLRTQHILHCFSLLILWWAVDAQNRWVAWLCRVPGFHFLRPPPTNPNNTFRLEYIYSHIALGTSVEYPFQEILKAPETKVSEQMKIHAFDVLSGTSSVAHTHTHKTVPLWLYWESKLGSCSD